MTKKLLVSAYIILTSINSVFGQCANSSNIYSFNYGGKNYEIIKENKIWVSAAACAVERGGFLAEINDANEQNAIFNQLISTNANINVNNTIAPEGVGSYVWIGGNDLIIEGNWVWNGNNDNTSTQFFMGNYYTGFPVGGLYNNWGKEPDNAGGQDALGLSLNGWPLGVAGEWNDLYHENTLYFIVEYPTLGVEDLDFENKIKVYPNPVVDFLTINTDGINFSKIIVYNSLGQDLKNINFDKNTSSESINLSTLNNGIYFMKINFQDGKSIIQKIVKE